MATDDVHRLRDILVEEVSLVDRAANKRRFLLVKREGDMSELRSDGRGGFTRVRKGDDDPEDADTEKAKGKKPPPFAAKKPDDEDPDAAGDEEAEKAKAKKKPFAGAAKPFGGKPAGDEGDEDQDEDEEKRKATAKARADMSGKIAALAGDLKALAEKIGEADDDDEPNDINMKKLLAVHRKLGGVAEGYMKRAAQKSVEVTKIGRKMSASRLAMYKDALETLQSLLSELIDSPKKDKEHQPDPGDPQVAPPGFKAANPSAAPTNATGAAAIKGIVEKMVGDLTDVIKTQGAKITRLEKGIGASNALAVDGVRKNRPATAVVWPTDVNARSRDSVNKGDSFLDD